MNNSAFALVRAASRRPLGASSSTITQYADKTVETR
jgi:hypothetical protein